MEDAEQLPLPLFRLPDGLPRRKLMTAPIPIVLGMVIGDCCQITSQRTLTPASILDHSLTTFQMLSRRLAAARPLSSAIRTVAPRTTITQLRFASENNANRENFVGELSVEDIGMVCYNSLSMPTQDAH
jgi:hypothetical protein